LVGSADLRGLHVLDVGCGRGGTVALLAEFFGADAMGVDLAPEAIAFCRRRHTKPHMRFEVGDAENLPIETESMDAVTNIESSHVYPKRKSFYGEVRRVLKPGGVFFYTDVFPAGHWADIQTAFSALGLRIFDDRDITANVLASCDATAARHAKAFGERHAQMDNVLAVPGSPVYEQMRSGAWEYRILRARRV
jgi:phthiocerol/phenolphthiocerol synthesis type-I polyketide synthase E